MLLLLRCVPSFFFSEQKIEYGSRLVTYTFNFHMFGLIKRNVSYHFRAGTPSVAGDRIWRGRVAVWVTLSDSSPLRLGMLTVEVINFHLNEKSSHHSNSEPNKEYRSMDCIEISGKLCINLLPIKVPIYFACFNYNFTILKSYVVESLSYNLGFIQSKYQRM